MLWIALALGGPTTGELVCDDAETMRLQCTTEKGARLALCESKQGWSYRYGKSEVELRYDGPMVGGRTFRPPEAYVHTLAFEREGHVYAVVADIDEGEVSARIEVAKGGKLLATLRCADARAALSELQIPPPPTSWLVGSWTGPTGSVHLTEKDGGLWVKGDATWVRDVEKGLVHTGELDGALKQDGATWSYASEGCEATLRLEGTKLHVQDNLGCGGMNVSFEGHYQRGT